MDSPLNPRLLLTAIAFRGYNTTNLGRTGALLNHRAYGAVMTEYLRRASTLCAESSGRPVDLIERVAQGRESTLETFGEDIGLIIAVEMAQLEMLKQFHGIDYSHAPLMFGYSLGEITALVAGGVYAMEDVLTPLVALAGECAELAHNATMGVVFSRGLALNLDHIERLCLEINQAGRGAMGVSSILSPNTVLILGQEDTIDRFKLRVKDVLGERVNLRKQSERWPPLHTPLMWQRSIPNRAAVLMHTMPHGLTAPQPPVLSLVTGKTSYTNTNSRALIAEWLDRPQRLWDAVYDVLAQGIDVLLHVGPDPNLIPATFKRLSDNVTAQIESSRLGSLGMRAMRGIAHRQWLTRLVSHRVALLRAPFVAHVILEDWLLEHEPR